MTVTRYEALKALDDIFNYCEEIDNSLPENERSGYEMLPDIHKIRKYIIENARPHGEWIPCAERLPEKMEDVLVWYEYFSYKRNKMVRSYGIAHVYKDFWGGDVQGERAECLAWMPLPEPYKKEGEVK